MVKSFAAVQEPPNALSQFLQLGGLCLALPDDKYLPSGATELSSDPGVTPPICIKFPGPELNLR